MDACELAGIHKLAQWQNLYGVIEFHSLAPFHPAGANQFTPLKQNIELWGLWKWRVCKPSTREGKFDRSWFLYLNTKNSTSQRESLITGGDFVTQDHHMIIYQFMWHWCEATTQPVPALTRFKQHFCINEKCHVCMFVSVGICNYVIFHDAGRWRFLVVISV